MDNNVTDINSKKKKGILHKMSNISSDDVKEARDEIFSAGKVLVVGACMFGGAFIGNKLWSFVCDVTDTKEETDDGL